MNRRQRGLAVAGLCVMLLLCGEARLPAQAGNSDPLMLMTYIGLVRGQVLESLSACSTPVCASLKALDRAVQGEKMAQLGVTFLFAQDVWLFDVAEPGNRIGLAATARRPDRTRVFVSRPIAGWSGDLLVIASSTSPQNLSILRVGGVGGITPVIRVLYDSLQRPQAIGVGEVPIGGVDEIHVGTAGTMTLRESEPLGSRGDLSPRQFSITVDTAGIRIRKVR